MGLDLIPLHDPCEELERLKALDLDDLHLDFTFVVCPLKGVSKYQGMFGTDCWCRGKVAAAELESLGYDEIAGELYEDKSDTEATELGNKLVAIAEGLRATDAQSSDKLTWDDTKKTWITPIGSTLDDAIDAIEDAGRWYKAVGGIRSGVVAWS